MNRRRRHKAKRRRAQERQLREYYARQPVRHGDIVSVVVPFNWIAANIDAHVLHEMRSVYSHPQPADACALPQNIDAHVAESQTMSYGTLEVVAYGERVIPLKDYPCPCCECNGIKCLTAHRGHSHRAEALIIAKNIEEHLLESLKLAPVNRPMARSRDIAKS